MLREKNFQAIVRKRVNIDRGVREEKRLNKEIECRNITKGK